MSRRFLMGRRTKGSWIIVVLSGFVLVIVVFLTFRLHNANKREVISQFKDHQFLHAQNIAQQIESLLSGHARSLQTLSSLISSHNDDIKQKRDTIHVYQKHLENLHVEAISLYDEFGERVCSAPRDKIGLKVGKNKLMAWAKEKKNRGKIFALALFPPEAGGNKGSAEAPKVSFLRLLLATPVYQDADQSQGGGGFAGLLTFTVDLKEFLETKLGFVDPDTNLQQVWIIDKSGTLLLQSEHPEMVSRSVYRKDEHCGECHISFDYVEKILKEKEGTEDYRLRNLPKKFAAFAPMEFESASWIVVVNSTHDDMMAYIKKDLEGHFLLLGIVAMVFILSSAFFVRDYRAMIRAEEEAKHWREKRSMEEKVRQSEVFYRTIVETAHDIIWILDDAGRFTFANKRAEEVFGYQISELMGKEITPFIHTEDLENLGPVFFKGSEHRPDHSEYRFLGKNGRVLTLSVNTAFLHDGNAMKGTVSFCRDITEEKQAELALKESEKQLRYLSSQLLTANETERRRISKELHDELGGGLSVLKLQLGHLSRGLHSDQTGLRAECHNTLSYIDQIIENVRRLIKDLSPPVVEDLGLTAGLHSLIDNFAKNYEIKVTSNFDGIDHLFSEKARIIVYRMIQEALNNIGKHSEAKNVTFAIEKDNGRVSFLVEDDGKGFDVGKVLSKNPSKKGLGLATMNERARMLGGSVHLWSEVGKGTRIRFSIPSTKEESSDSVSDGGGP